METIYMFMVRLYGIKRLEKENNGRVVFAWYEFLAGHKIALGGQHVARGP